MGEFKMSRDVPKRFAGVTELEQYQNTRKHLGLSAMVKAKCADCMAKYADGRMDCKMEDCPLYPRMPYRSTRKINSKATSTPLEPSPESGRVEDGIMGGSDT